MVWGKVRKGAVVIGLAFSYLAGAARAQAGRAATRSAEVSVFGSFGGLHPDYGSGSDFGLLFGADLTPYVHFPLVPSFESRVGFSSGGVVANQHFVAFGGRVELNRWIAGRFHPYANFLAGSGTINFTHPSSNYSSDNSIIYNYGAGVDYDLGRRLSLKGEFDGQSWKLGTGYKPLTPTMFSGGVRYRVRLGQRPN